MSVYINALLYGDYPDLHARLLDSFERFIPDGTPVHLWLNTVGKDSLERVTRLQNSRDGYVVTESTKNVPKYLAMAEMFKDAKARAADDDWVVWFDDDSYILGPKWMNRVMQRIGGYPAARYIGVPAISFLLPGQWNFICRSKWFKGLPALKVQIKGEKKPGVCFVPGSYFWLRGDALRELDWPDERLVHNGGDTLLGEAVRQQGWQFLQLPMNPYKVTCGVKFNDAERRGMDDPPAGIAKNVMR